ncbi:MAG: hypothetical protein IJS19_01620 [Muribaculaceae bacterium]|nr:hypothetical protein [Muribaculaceae bacterium]
MKSLRNILPIILVSLVFQSFYVHFQREVEFGKEDYFILNSWEDVPNDSLLLSVSKSFDSNVCFVDTLMSDSCSFLYGIFVDVESGNRTYQVYYRGADIKLYLTFYYADSLLFKIVSPRCIDMSDYPEIMDIVKANIEDIDKYICSVPLDLFKGDRKKISNGFWCKGVLFISPKNYVDMFGQNNESFR